MYETNRFNKIFAFLLPYAELCFIIEENGIAAEHAHKLAVLFENETGALDYVSGFIKANKSVDNVMHDANLYAMPTGKWDQNIWRELCAKHMGEEIFRSKILPRADGLESFIQFHEKKFKINKENVANINKIAEQTKKFKRLILIINY